MISRLSLVSLLLVISLGSGIRSIGEDSSETVGRTKTLSDGKDYAI